MKDPEDVMYLGRNNHRRRGAGSPFRSQDQFKIRTVKKRQRNERAVVNALNSRWNAPDWFLGCHIASEEQDREGIDVVVQTIDAAELFLQVKSSSHGRLQSVFEEFDRGQDRPLAIIVVREQDTKEDIRRKVLRAITDLRDRHLRLARERTPASA